MPLFRKLPLTIEARQFLGERSGLEIATWVTEQGGRCRWYDYRVESIMPYRDGDLNALEHPEHLEIDTLEGLMSVPVGFWVLRGVTGEFYACEPEIFAKTYVPVPDADG